MIHAQGALTEECTILLSKATKEQGNRGEKLRPSTSIYHALGGSKETKREIGRKA